MAARASGPATNFPTEIPRPPAKEKDAPASSSFKNGSSRGNEALTNLRDAPLGCNRNWWSPGGTELNHNYCYPGLWAMGVETDRCIKIRCYPEWMQKCRWKLVAK